MRVRTAVILVAVAVMTVASGSVPTAVRGSYSRIVVFGTSLSDAGNAFALLGGTNTPPNYDVDPFLIPSTPYAKGGHHFSNGATWVEQFARPMGLAGSVRPAFGDSDTATNFAVGGARAHEDGMNFNLSAQVAAFLQRSGGVAPSDGLYVIEMGSNDIRDALVVFAGGGNGAPILEEASVAIAQNVAALHAAGARQFLIWRAPDVGLTPAIRALDSYSAGAVLLATTLTQAFNDGLDAAVAQLSGLPGITIVRLDAFRLLDEVVADPAAFGLTTVTTACLTPSTPPWTCFHPDEFLFWDGIHPTAAGHAIVAQEARNVLGQ